MMGSNEHPIAFNAEMVRAILAGRKTQTRRVIIPQPIWVRPPNTPFKTHDADPRGIIKCPYGVPGDRLWVRETWRVGAWNEDTGEICVDYRADGFVRKEFLKVPDPEQFTRLWIQSSDDARKAGITCDADGKYHWKPGEAPTRWRSPRFMYRCTSRIILEVTKVRVERIQEISGMDSKAEGIVCIKPGSNTYDYINKFHALWDSINAGRGYGWEKNPRVWVIEFQKVQEYPANNKGE